MSHAKPSLALIALMAAVVAVTPLAIDMYLPAMPQITSQLATTPGVVQQSLSIFLAFYALGMLIFGPIADQIGRRHLALGGLLGFIIASILLSFAPTIEWFLAGRALQAFLGSAATVVIPGLIRALYQENTAKGMSYVSMMMMLAPLLAPAIGSALLLLSDWRLIFMVLAGYAVIVLLFAVRYFPEVQSPATAASQHQVKLAFLQSYAWVLGNRPAQPLIAISMFASFSFFCFLTAVPFVYIEHYGVDAQLFSLLFGFNVMALIIANFSNSKLVPKVGSERMMQLALRGGLCVAIGLVLIAWFEGPLWLTALAIAPLMASLSVCATNADALILIRFPQQSGTATAVIGTLRFGAGALAGPLLALGGHDSIVPFAALMLSGLIAIACCQEWRRAQVK